MPSYYTVDIYEGKNVSFQDFALKCARQFGAFVHMNEEDPDSPLTRPTVSDYYKNSLRETENEFALFLKASREQREKMFEIEMEKELKHYKEKIEEEKELEEKYQNLLEQAKAYKPPTKEFNNYKDYMLNQLNQAIKFDCSNEQWYLAQIASVEAETFDIWEQEKMDLYNSKITYYKESYKKEMNSVSKKNQWIDLLYESLGVE